MSIRGERLVGPNPTLNCGLSSFLAKKPSCTDTAEVLPFISFWTTREFVHVRRNRDCGVLIYLIHLRSFYVPVLPRVLNYADAVNPHILEAHCSSAYNRVSKVGWHALKRYCRKHGRHVETG